MTASFRLGADGLTTFEFLSGAIRLAEGWTIGETLTESWTFIGQGTGAVLRAELADLTALLNNAREWATDPLRSGPTWLEFHADGEPDSRRRLVLDGGREFLNRTGINPLMTNQRVAIEIKLEFAYPWWEKEGETTVFNQNVGCLGGKLYIPAGGDMDGRIARLTLSGGSSAMTKYWIGMRQVYDGTSDLETRWAISQGMDAVDSSNTADTDCISSNRKTVTFATTTALAQRSRMLYTTIAGAVDYTHLTGRYLALLRYKLPTSASAVALEMRYGYVNDTLAIQDAVIVTTGGSGMSTYGVVELGMVQFPAGSPRGLAATMDDLTIDIYAERITGSTQLHLAELILIPSDHLIKVTGAAATTHIYTHADEEVVAFGVVAGFTTGTVRPEPENWRIPYQANSVLVIVGAISSTSLSEADNINLALYAHKCWQSYST